MEAFFITIAINAGRGWAINFFLASTRTLDEDVERTLLN